MALLPLGAGIGKVFRKITFPVIGLPNSSGGNVQYFGPLYGILLAVIGINVANFSHSGLGGFIFIASDLCNSRIVCTNYGGETADLLFVFAQAGTGISSIARFVVGFRYFGLRRQPYQPLPEYFVGLAKPVLDILYSRALTGLPILIDMELIHVACNFLCNWLNQLEVVTKEGKVSGNLPSKIN